MRRSAMTLTELVVTIAILTLLSNLALPAVQRAREAARSMQCQSRLRELGLAIHNYHATYDEFPMHGGGTADSRGRRLLRNEQSNHHRRGIWVAILPFIERQPLWEQISHPMKVPHVNPGSPNSIPEYTYPSMGPVPWINTRINYLYPPWGEAIKELRCPSDPAGHGRNGETNYAACFGDGVRELGCAYLRPQWVWRDDASPRRFDDSTKRGIFANWHPFGFRDCKDGASTTMMLSEIGVADGSRRVVAHVWAEPQSLADFPDACSQAIDPQRGGYYRSDALFERGGRWADAGLSFSAFNAVLPPNSPSCVESTSFGAYPDWFGGVFSAGSYHVRGVHVVFVDGSTRFVSSDINSKTDGASRASVYQGGAAKDSQSPYGVWGAMGTRASSETVP